MNPPSVNNLCDYYSISLLNLGSLLGITSILLIDHTVQLDFLPFSGTTMMSGPVSRPLHITMF